MQDGEVFLCSQLMKVSTSRTVTIGNLEDICATKCTVAIEAPPQVGLQVTIRCIECPVGKKGCTDCRFRGWVRSHENDPVIGCFMQVEFEGRIWSPKEWHPQHLTKIESLARCAEHRFTMLSARRGQQEMKMLLGTHETAQLPARQRSSPQRHDDQAHRH
jgi:hypothetical protein